MPKKLHDIAIHSVAQFVSELEQTASDTLRLFRGQNTDQCLLRRLMRLAKQNGISTNDIDLIEVQMLDRFKYSNASHETLRNLVVVVDRPT